MSTARNADRQPMTRNVNDLVIGLMKVRVGDSEDLSAAPAGSGDAGYLEDLGAVQAASMVMEMTYKEHVSGYPEEEDFKVLETKTVGFKISPEEVGSDEIRTMLNGVLETIKTGTLGKYGVEGTIQKSNGDLIRVYSNHCELRPEISISTDNDWGAIEFNFEWAYNALYTNRLPIYKSTESLSARTRDEMPITKSPDNLVIGRPQIRIANIGTSATGAPAVTASDIPLSASIGAIQGATLAIAPTFKEHTAGYPEMTDLTMLERVSVELEVQIEEFATASGGIESGGAETFFDILLDTVANNRDYYCTAHVIWELATGGTLQFYVPNAMIESSAEIATQQDWSQFPVKLIALKQVHLGASAPDLIYLLDKDAPIITE